MKGLLVMNHAQDSSGIIHKENLTFLIKYSEML